MSDWKQDLRPGLSINPPSWMQDADTQEIFTALKGQVLFVGGCVRNALLHLPVDDIDLATPLKPDAVMSALENAGIRTVPTGVAHGTVTAILNMRVYEITTLRRDEETDGRHAQVAFTDSWHEDIARRDFTMNALLADLQGNIYDLTGRGVEDTLKGRVVFVGNPEERIEEDYLRILRFFRFFAHYGRGPVDQEAYTACAKLAPFIFALSHERITKEFFKLLEAENANTSIDLLERAGILEYFNFPYKEDPSHDPHLMATLCAFQKHYKLPSVTARLFVFSGLLPENVHKLETLLIVPKVFKKEMETLVRILALPDLDHEHVIHRAVYLFGRTLTLQALMLSLALGRVENGNAPPAIDMIQKWPIPEFPLSGKDLLAAGVKQGPNIGRVLDAIEEWWIGEEFKPSRQDCIARAKTFLKRLR
ncbi:MAG: CCA tRNA nucleotidyltransferase [Alphaproteobacteria bacterium]|nr:CCA tRNA nucleotidyltransferase [Alphaproteobacteria bacterium]